MVLVTSVDQWGCLLVVAGPGYGKTTALRRLLPPSVHAWAGRSIIERLVAGELPARPAPAPTGPRRWLVLDDVPELDAEIGQRLFEWATTLPASTGVAVAARGPAPVAVSRWRGRGSLGVLSADDLAMTADDVDGVLRDDYDLREPRLATRLHTWTGGWPALVHLTAELTVRSLHETQLEGLTRPDTGVSQYVADEILPALSPGTQRLLRDLATFDPISVDLGRELGHRGAQRPFDDLIAAGVVRTSAAGGHYLVPVVAAVAARTQRSGRAAKLAESAARWYGQHGPPIAAAQAQLAAGHVQRAAHTLAERGDDILAAGSAAQYVALVNRLPSEVRTSRLRLCWGDALRTVGDMPGALAVFSALAHESGEADDLPPGLAWRMGLLHYLRSDPRTALETLTRAAKAADDPVDEVLVLSWTATAYWMLGEADAATRHAESALHLAGELGSDRALAAAHTAMALSVKAYADAAGADSHYAQALTHAHRAGDRMQATRILANQAHELLAQARYPQALTTARAAVATAEEVGPAGILVVALCNEAEALNRLGRFDEAARQFARAIATCHQIGPHRSAGALSGLGDVHRRRGWREQARAAYEQALALARDSRENQALMPSLLGLARVLVDADPVAAAHIVAEAQDAATGSSTAAVCVAHGWVLLAHGDVDGARQAATRAAGSARVKPALLADALELRAAAETDVATIRAALREAYTIWAGNGSVVDADRIVTTLGALPDSSNEERLAASMAWQRQADRGVQHQAAAVRLAVDSGEPSVQIRVMGRFEVRVADAALAASAWQSRKARDLLRILVARRGRAVPREEIAEMLWPGEDTGSTGHRLSVLLSIVRTVLDPSRGRPTDHYVMGDKSGVALDLTRTRVDVEDFLDAVAYGSRLYEEGDDAQARAVLAAAVTSYGGEPFEDEPYADWTAGLREQARAALLRGLRTLARLARRAGAVDGAVQYILAILDLDPYDEDAHRTLVATLATAGRHGEAQRARQRYRDAMEAIGVAVT